MWLFELGGSEFGYCKRKHFNTQKVFALPEHCNPSFDNSTGLATN
jgi:hypothetical protein